MLDAPYQRKGKTVAELHLVNETCCVANRTFLKFIFTLQIIAGVKVRVQPIFQQNNIFKTNAQMWSNLHYFIMGLETLDN